MARRHARVGALGLAAAAFLAFGSAAAAHPAPVEFHEDYLRALSAPGPDPEKPLEIFSLVYRSLPDRITVYPSEGYYYFSFRSGGELLRGNIRFDVKARDEGKVAFAYFYDEDPDSERSARLPDGRFLGPAEGLRLRKIAPFRYAMEWQGRRVDVTIYDAAAERARPLALHPGEELVGPSYDESGVRFWLVFNRRIADFYYVLNDRFGHIEKYVEVAFQGPGPRILIGTATRFAYLADEGDGRMYLIGVDHRRVAGNSWYDGPFDQLPDSFADPARVRDLIVLSDPRFKGKLGGHGHFLENADARYAIAPYLEYTATAQLEPYRRCTVGSGGRDSFFTCLSAASQGAAGG